MADHVQDRRLWLPCPRPRAFALLTSTAERAVVQPGSGFAWLGTRPDRVEAWTLLDFRVRLLGVRARWRVIVRELDPPYRFVEAALRGPFPLWEHRCRLVEGPAGPGGPPGTWLHDTVLYRLPLGPLGEWAHALGWGGALARAFEEREQRLTARVARADRSRRSAAG
jgi:ligand-binding SRPBCC domain-containing protein